jgi:glycolate oxidase FAD binding subunit
VSATIEPEVAAQVGGHPVPGGAIGRVVRDPELLAFAEEVGGAEDGPVAVAGGRTQWEIGGRAAPGVRLVAAPRGIVAFEAAEMTVLVRAGTTVAELDAALEPSGQQVALGGFAPAATVGGVLAVGLSGPHRLGEGPLRDSVLQIRYVSAEGLLVTAGGPTVKNVTGFDLCRLLVGSLGTVGLIGDVLLRTRPRPERVRWLAGQTDPFALRAVLYRPAALLWDGTTVWVRLAGHPDDVDAQAAIAARFGLDEVEHGPPLPAGRTSVDPGLFGTLAASDRAGGGFVAEIGVGVVHGHWPGAPPPPPSAAVVALNRRIKAAFDPTGRLNPGRDPLHRLRPPGAPA